MLVLLPIFWEWDFPVEDWIDRKLAEALSWLPSCRERLTGSAIGSLPLHLLVKIMAKALHYDNIVSLQLVCKSWREACRDHIGGLDSAEVKIDHPLGLFRVCKMMPNLTWLDVKCRTAFSLHPLCSFSRLENLYLTKGHPQSEFVTLDLLPLPSGLRELRIECFEVNPSHFEFIQFTQLTRLVFTWWRAPKYKLSLLLDRLPRLEVRHLTHSLQYSFVTACLHQALQITFL